ncbi:MAG: pyridoxal 5'-phosphate synthase glutaminase subunit PdxT [Planctomycetota bacterium]
MTSGEAPRLGVLALQGDFARHEASLAAAGAAASQVRLPAHLEGLAGLVLPGGESTTLLKLLSSSGLDAAIPAFHEQGGALFGTCAGAILLARTVTKPEQVSLGLLDASVERNHYGRQIDSFETDLALNEGPAFRAVFIRAPAFTAVGDDVEVLAEHDGLPVLVREDRILAATFHPELTDDARVHGMFVEMCSA